MTEHTRGPWAAARSPSGYWSIGRASRHPDNVEFELFHIDGEPEGEDAANARLIAAAPDLLAALEAVVCFFEEATDYEATHPFEYASPLKARAAIAKAHGQNER